MRPRASERIGVAYKFHLAVPGEEDLWNCSRPRNVRRPPKTPGRYAEQFVDVATVACPPYFFALPLASAASASANWSAVLAAGLSSALKYSINVGVMLMMPA